jgi:hypothetical protein
MWPRKIFDRLDILGKGQSKKFDLLKRPGVYVLYQDGEPYYVGKAEDSMRGRISQHASNPAQRRYLFWNYFSAFVIEDKDIRSKVEGILIAAMPTANGANPRLPREKMPNEVRDLLRELRVKKAFGQWPSKPTKTRS